MIDNNKDKMNDSNRSIYNYWKNGKIVTEVPKEEFPESTEFLHKGWMHFVWIGLGFAIGVVVSAVILVIWLSKMISEHYEGI